MSILVRYAGLHSIYLSHENKGNGVVSLSLLFHMTETLSVPV